MKRGGVRLERERESMTGGSVRGFLLCRRHVGCYLSNMVVLIDLDNSGQEEEQQCQDQHDKVVVYKNKKDKSNVSTGVHGNHVFLSGFVVSATL